jgi:hypothetical protein
LKRSFVLALIVIALLSTASLSQTKRRSSSKSRQAQAAAAQKAATQKAVDVQTGRQQIVAQIKTLTQFLYLYGGIVKGIESIDDSTEREKPPARVLDQNERNKTRIRESLNNVRDGLLKLETDFRTKPALSNYYYTLAGVSRTAEAAATQANANRFDEAGRSLISAVGKLADTLSGMR